MNFGQALEELKSGKKVQRKGWNGKGMWLVLIPSSINIQPHFGTPYHNAGYNSAGLTERVNINAHIDMCTAQGDMQPGWVASQTDMLADDWQTVA